MVNNREDAFYRILSKNLKQYFFKKNIENDSICKTFLIKHKLHNKKDYRRF